MARQFATPIALPADPTSTLHASTKGYVDTGLAGKAATVHTHTAAQLPLVKDAPVTLAYAASLTPDASAGNLQYCTATGNLTLNPPSNPADGQKLHIRFISSGGAWTVTLAAGFHLASGVAATLAMTSGRRGDVGLFYELADAAWTVLAATTA